MRPSVVSAVRHPHLQGNLSPFKDPHGHNGSTRRGGAASSNSGSAEKKIPKRRRPSLDIRYDVSKDAEIIASLKLGKRWNDTLAGSFDAGVGREGLTCLKLEHMAALKIQSRFRTLRSNKALKASKAKVEPLPVSSVYGPDMVSFRLRLHKFMEDPHSRYSKYLSKLRTNRNIANNVMFL